MKTILREAPYSLVFKDLVIAKFRSRNAIGWSNNYSNENSVGALVQIEPSTMAVPERGSSTDSVRIQIDWTELTGDETGGASILSYNLEWDVDGTQT